MNIIVTPLVDALGFEDNFAENIVNSWNAYNITYDSHGKTAKIPAFNRRLTLDISECFLAVYVTNNGPIANKLVKIEGYDNYYEPNAYSCTARVAIRVPRLVSDPTLFKRLVGFVRRQFKLGYIFAADARYVMTSCTDSKQQPAEPSIEMDEKSRIVYDVMELLFDFEFEIDQALYSELFHD